MLGIVSVNVELEKQTIDNMVTRALAMVHDSGVLPYCRAVVPHWKRGVLGEVKQTYAVAPVGRHPGGTGVLVPVTVVLTEGYTFFYAWVDGAKDGPTGAAMLDKLGDLAAYHGHVQQEVRDGWPTTKWRETLRGVLRVWSRRLVHKLRRPRS